MVRPRREPHLGWTPERVSHRICDPLTLDTAWYRQFSGATKFARGGMKFSFEKSPKALNLMTVQREADPPLAETGADLRSDTDRLKTGARDSNDRTLTSCLTGEEKKFFSAGKSVPT